MSFGGRVDSSWRRSSADLRRDLQGVERQSSRLRREQASLAAEIRRATLEGRRVRSLEREYARVTAEIHRADEAQRRLNRSLERQEQFGRFMGRGRGLLAGSGRFAVNAGLAMGGGMVTSALGALIAPAVVNAEMAETAGKATSYGVDARTYMNWDAVAKQYDMTGDNIGDLFEEYLHKSGEYKQTGRQSALSDAFETLGFEAGDLAGLSDLAQFERIIDRALSLDDESKASFALDSLFGGEASKLLMLLRRSGKSFQTLMEEQQRYNLVTKAGTEGALAGHRAFSDLRTVFSSAISEISGLLGAELSPVIRQTADDLAQWFRNGGVTKIVGFMQDTVYPAALNFGKGVILVGRVAFALARKLSWLLPDERGDQKDILEFIGAGRMDIARKIAADKGQETWLDEQMKNNPDFEKDVREKYDAEKGFLDIVDRDAFHASVSRYLTPELSPDAFLPQAEEAEHRPQPGGAYWHDIRSGLNVADSGYGSPQLTDNRKFSYQFMLNTQPGQSPEAFADAIAGMTKTSPAFNGNNALWDGGSIW